jgi:hypothetical protein
MAQNGTLTPKQLALVTALLGGQKVEEAARLLNIGKSTAYRWVQDDAVQQALEEGWQRAFNDALKPLRTGVTAALASLARNMGKDAPPAVQVRAATAWLQFSLDVHKMDQLEARMAELEAMARPASGWRA